MTREQVRMSVLVCAWLSDTWRYFDRDPEATARSIAWLRTEIWAMLAFSPLRSPVSVPDDLTLAYDVPMGEQWVAG